MSLEIPDLDDRSYREYLNDARRRIPVDAPEWTDHNAHDPGITILETLAWLAETYAYQLDRVTETHRLKYLKLLGERPAAPQPAGALLQLTPPLGGEQVELSGGEVLAVDSESATTDPQLWFSVVLDTDEHVDTPVETVRLARARVERVVADYPTGRTDNSIANETDAMQFSAFGPKAAEESAMYLGFDGNPFERSEPTDEDEVVRISLGIEFDESNLPVPATHGAEPPQFEPTVDLVWQHCTDYDEWYDETKWEPIPVVRDETKQLYGGGLVFLERPREDPDDQHQPPKSGWNDEPGEILDLDGSYHWIRCVVRQSGHEVPPRLNRVAINVARVTHKIAIVNEKLRRIDGQNTTTARPGQTFTFAHQPVLEANVVVSDENRNNIKEWTEVEDFDSSDPNASVYILDETRGELRFGDEIAGAVPVAGRTVEAVEYVHGGGVAGNVRQPATWQFTDDALCGIAVTQLTDATGGADAETVDDALARLRRDLKRRYRAVTLADYESVATQTPGLRFGRAKAFVEAGRPTREGNDCEGRPSVRVVVVPFSTRSRPEPSDGFLTAVCCHLREHALLTDRVTVEPPVYAGVGVTAVIRMERGYAEADRTAAVVDALEQFFHPLSGFEGDGWPFGRPVYRSEVYETITKVDGIDCVLDVSLTTGDEGRLNRDGDVVLGEAGLPYSLRHDVTVKIERDECGRGF